MKNKLPLKLGILSTLLLFFAFIPKDDDPIDKLVAALQKWTETMPQEKVYLHMDKPYYAVGDTIWFKGYITVGSRHQLSALSGALHVDLISEQDSIVRSLKLPITSGMVMGNFILNDDFQQGSYRIRAYTQWMRNAGEDYFFDKTFTVGDLISHNIIAKADYQYKDINGKPVLTATLNYTDDGGKPIGGKNIEYQIYIDKKKVWTSSAKTDAQGNIPVSIANDAHLDLSGSYIHTSLAGNDKYPIIRDFPIKAALAQSDVQFFPESGNLVNGITSRVAFKAVGVDGLGIPITGKIVDETNAEVATLETLHAGMGSFSLKPSFGKSYTAKIIFADGTNKTMALPKAIDGGYVLSVYQPNKDSVLIRIKTSIVRAQNVSFIAHTNGEIIFSSPIKITNAVTSLWLNKQSFPTGIAQFTLFNNAGEPLNERIAFIRSNDQMQLTIKTAKTSYKSKEHIQVDMEAKDSKGNPTFGNFSVAVIDESKVPFDEASESTIFSNLLLTSDLKGYVEKPNYYFTNENDEVNKALDNLMLTQGYRRFNWQKLLDIEKNKPVFEAEGLGINISGKVTTLAGKLLPNATVNLISVKAKIAKATTTDTNGQFTFDGIFLMDSMKFAVQARAGKNSDKVKIILDSIPKLLVSRNKNTGDMSTDITQLIKTYIDNGRKLDDIYEKTGQLDKVHRLREVRIRAKKKEIQTYATQGLLRIHEGSEDQSFIMKDAEHCATLGICLQAQLRGVVFRPYEFFENGIKYMYTNFPFCKQRNEYVPIKIIIDGTELRRLSEIGDLFDKNILDPLDIVKIDIVIQNQAMLGVIGGPSMLIYTKRGLPRAFFNPSIANIMPKGFNKVREFYSPKYNAPNPLPDIRTTVYWNPYLKTDVEGRINFTFFNPDGPGKYKVIVEGINKNGELTREFYRYRVE